MHSSISKAFGCLVAVGRGQPFWSKDRAVASSEEPVVVETTGYCCCCKNLARYSKHLIRVDATAAAGAPCAHLREWLVNKDVTSYWGDSCCIEVVASFFCYEEKCLGKRMNQISKKSWFCIFRLVRYNQKKHKSIKHYRIVQKVHPHLPSYPISYCHHSHRHYTDAKSQLSAICALQNSTSKSSNQPWPMPN
jgi:hypothetical protein